MLEKLIEANKNIAVLESLSSRIPNIALFVSMYVRSAKDAIADIDKLSTLHDANVFKLNDLGTRQEDQKPIVTLTILRSYVKTLCKTAQTR